MDVTPGPVWVPTQRLLVPSFTSVVGKAENFSDHPRITTCLAQYPGAAFGYLNSFCTVLNCDYPVLVHSVPTFSCYLSILGDLSPFLMHLEGFIGVEICADRRCSDFHLID